VGFFLALRGINQFSSVARLGRLYNQSERKSYKANDWGVVIA